MNDDSTTKLGDMVSPTVYHKSGNAECIEVMEDIAPNTMVANAIKYLWRFDAGGTKGGVYAVSKAVFYLYRWMRRYHGDKLTETLNSIREWEDKQKLYSPLAFWHPCKEEVYANVAGDTQVHSKREPHPTQSGFDFGLEGQFGDRNNIVKDLASINPDAVTWDGFDDALVGIGETWRDDGHIATVAVYDKRRMRGILMDRDGMSPDEADEYLDFNVYCAYVGPYTPIHIYPYMECER